LGPAALAAKNILHKKPGKIRGKDVLLRYTRLFTVLVGVLGVFIAIKIPQPGILLTLAFDIVLCSLFACFVFGNFWVVNKSAALYSIVIGAILRLVFFVLTPTVYGAPYTLLYFDNNMFSAAFDGWATIAPFVVSLFVYVAVQC